MILKAELHCHIEGAAAPELVVAQARKYGKDPSPYIQDGSFVWHDFTSFLAAYDFASDLFRTEDDYARLADYYLTSLARDGAIYSEVFTSPDHAKKAGLSPKAYTDALGEGMARAKAKTGIEGRMIVTGVRHVGVEAIEQAARFAARCGHPLVTGFGVAGDERIGDFEDYVRAFEIAREAGLGITIHAGELMGWESVAAALDHIRPARIGHGVRAIENPDLVRRIADQGVVLE
ncbi:MAG: adenosine deaminase, partial [Mesorhizobium sp.]